MESNHINIAYINARSIAVINESGARLDHINEFLIKDLNPFNPNFLIKFHLKSNDSKWSHWG